MNGDPVYGHWGRSDASLTAGATTIAHNWPSWHAQLAHHLPRFS